MIEFFFGLAFAFLVYIISEEKKLAKHQEFNRIVESEINKIIEETSGTAPEQNLADRLNDL
tara:strand:+ start:261 stop:443 length:183 start_codon:yes stop_codon:yes gene_type:complete